MAYDKQNEVLIGQWNDNKVVNFSTTLNEAGIGTVLRRVGSARPSFPCPLSLRMYQQNMFGVDKGDQMRCHGAGFSRRVHFKKWYKKVYLAILDCGLLNAYIAWNLSTEERSIRRAKLERHVFYAYIAQRMQEYVDPHQPAAAVPTSKVKRALPSQCGHVPQKPNGQVRCAVCMLEYHWDNSLGMSGVRSNVAECKKCGVIAHMFPVQRSNRMIHTLQVFKGLSCFDIMHTKLGSEIWKPAGGNNRFRYVAEQGHPTVMELREKYNRPCRRYKQQQPEAPTVLLPEHSQARQETEELPESINDSIPSGHAEDSDTSDEDIAAPTTLFTA